MSKSYEKYITSSAVSSGGKSYDKYIIQPVQKPTEDSTLALMGKSFGSGVLSNLDIPQTVATFVEKYGLNPEYGLYGQGRKAVNYLRGKPHVPLNGPTLVQSLPENIASGNIKAGLKEGLGLDLTPKPTTSAQRVLSHIGEFAGGMGPFGLLNKGKGIVNVAKGFGKSANTGAVIGGISGGLQEAGVNPLAADIGTSLAVPMVTAANKNLLNKFSKEHRETKLNQKVANALKNQIGNENVPDVLKNIKEYKSDRNKPLKLKLTTPELAQNVGLSRLYRTQTNSELLPAKYRENDKILRETLENLGTTGLEESAKGEAIRTPFFKNFNKNKERRARLTKSLYDQLESIQEGIATPESRKILEKELSVSSPSNKGSLIKYLKGLNRNEIDSLSAEKAQALQNTLKNIDIDYKDLNQSAKEQIKTPLLQELNQLESAILPRPIQIENTIQELGDKVNALSKAGEMNAARKYGGIKEAYETDLRKNPIGLKHREEYKRLSKPINEIEKSSLLNNFIKQNTDVKQLEGYVLPSEKIPTSIINADIPNTKLLMQKVSGDKETLALVKGVYMDELLKRATLSSGNFSYDKANKFLNSKYNKEKIALVFNKDERKKIDHFLDTLDRRAKVETMGKVSGSDTHQKFKVENEFNNSLGVISNLMEKWAVNTSGTGKIGSTFLDSTKNVLNRLRNNKYNSLLEQSLADPNVFENLMQNEHKLKTFKDFYNPIPALTTGVNLGNTNRK